MFGEHFANGRLMALGERFSENPGSLALISATVPRVIASTPLRMLETMARKKRSVSRPTRLRRPGDFRELVARGRRRLGWGMKRSVTRLSAAP
jgi:hypothetical protein